MAGWDADHYLKFGDERTRPVEELVRRIELEAPARIVDLGCGPGNSTAVLRGRWPEASIVGVDSSEAMLAAAREVYPEAVWELGDMVTWGGDRRFDLVFSNAALQWVQDQEAVLARLFSMVDQGGVLAFQIPCNMFSKLRVMVREISEDAAWTDRMEGARTALRMEEPSFYYDVLAGAGARIDLWETEYHHVMPESGAIVEWIASTGLRPFLEALEEEGERERFTGMLRERVKEGYPERADGKVLFPFRRLFVVGYR
ncbi:MAG: methyltransferase domain-containing protein [Verrucomicrobiota bacterium]